MILRYAIDLHEKLIAKLSSHSRVITSTSYLTGEYSSFRMLFEKAAGKDERWCFTDHKSSVLFGFASEEDARLDDSVKVGDFVTIEVGRLDELSANGRTYVNPKNMSVCPGVSKDHLYRMMVSYVMNLFATTKDIEDQLKLVVCFIWSEAGGALFIDNYREGVDDQKYEVHPYIRAGWDAKLTSLVPQGWTYNDASTLRWAQHFHNYLWLLQIDYEWNYDDEADRWCARLISAAERECFISKDRSTIGSATEDCLLHIGSLVAAEVLDTHEYTIIDPYKEAV